METRNTTGHERCTLLSGTFDTLVQVGLGLFALTVLVVKRYLERPMRPVKVWLFDASKQAIGAFAAHGANMFIAILLTSAASDNTEADQCAFYFVNFTLDTTFGVLLNYAFLRLLVRAAERRNWTTLQVPGDYGNPIRLRTWLLQLSTWILIIFTVKIVIGSGIFVLEGPLGDVAAWIFHPLREHPHIELLIVMVACPCLMNGLQFWMTPEASTCKLLSGPFETLIQVVLGFIAMSVLVVKRMRESPRRPLGVWLFDAGKQAIGAGVAHAANLAIAIVLVGFSHKKDTADQCAMYFINFTLDTSFGVLLNWALLQGLVRLAKHFKWAMLQVPGEYGDPIRVTVWLVQLTSWLVIILLTKVIIGRVILLFHPQLEGFGDALFEPLRDFPRTELVLVMIACPCLMNGLQFWVQDSFLKKKHKYELVAKQRRSLPSIDDDHRLPDIELALCKKT
ncbi:hypothetical protein ACHHYP_10346 [Achlya hypogyna]|uniref:Transmembrane protein n=1 Tax=Achlya hypogyna TaxID=1202772 RepID=A0A1V9YLN0_ACHHY|nr:hypothetical protein ACHHYP_10346 [Achlya hypogyna]